MRSTRYLFSTLILLSRIVVAFAGEKELHLPVPQIEGDVLFAYDPTIFGEVVGEFGVNMPPTALTTIVKQPGWMPIELIVLCSEKDGRSWLLIRRGQDKQDPKRAKVWFEDGLAQRINMVITHELARSKRSPHRTPAFDTNSYIFSQPERPTLIGETGGNNPKSTVGYLCHVVDLISEYCYSDVAEHTRLLGEIDRTVTAIEIAYKETK